MKELFLRNRLCIPVKGHHRSIIYDLERKDYYFIPNFLYQIINTTEIIDFENSDRKVIEKWKSFLLKEEIIFKINESQEKHYFPEVSQNFLSPNVFTNLIIHQNFRFRFLKYFHHLFFENVSVIVDDISCCKLTSILRDLAKLEVNTINIYVKARTNIKLEDLEQIEAMDQILTIYFFNKDSNKTFTVPKNFWNLNVVQLKNTFEYFKESMVEFKLNVSNQHFFEALNYNNYYNGKIYIDESGSIKNGLNCSQAFGNIFSMSETEFFDVINSEEFKKIWKIRKDDILVCQDCEFRYMCLDPRELSQNTEGKWYNKKECSYNPYLSKWSHEAGYQNLLRSGVTMDDSTFLIDIEVLTKKFLETWN